MGPRSLERRFDRFRRVGDPAALASVFDATAAEILKVASYLASDPAAAEDLLQRTFLTAIEAAATWDRSRRLLPWLLGILTNHAKEASRRAARSLDPTRLASQEAESPVEAAERREETAAASRAIDDLPDPGRIVLVLRYRHGLEPAEIALALGLPPSTVRSHLHRGIERVRKKVPGALVAVAGPCLAPRGMAEIRRVVVARATSAGAEIAASVGVGVGVSGLVIGGLLVGKKSIALAAGLLLLLGGGIYVISAQDGGRDGVTQDAPATALEVERQGPTLASRVESRGDPLVAEPVVVTAVPDATKGALEVRVLARDGTAIADEPFSVDPRRGSGTLGWQFGRTGADGVGRVAGLEPGEVSVYSGHGPWRHDVVVEAGGVAQAEIRLPRGLDVEGVVVDAAGSPVGGAEVWVDHGGGRSYGMLAVTRTKADGGFALKDVESPATLFARAGGHAPSRVTQLQLAAGNTETVRLVLDGPGASVRGRVVDAGGSPVAGALVEIGPPTVPPQGPSLATWGAYPQPFLMSTGDDGTFSADGLPVGRAWITVRALGQGPYRADRDLLSGPTPNEMRIALAAGVAIERVVVDTAGSPVEGAWISAHCFWGYVGGWRTKTDAQGRFRLADLPSEQSDQLANLFVSHEVKGNAALYAHVGNQKTGLLYSSAPIVLQPWVRIHVRVVDERGEAIANREVSAQRASDPRTRSSGPTDADGRATLQFSVLGTYLGTYEVYVTDPEGDDLQPSSRLRGVRSGSEEVTLTVREQDRPTARIVGRIVLPGGRLPDGARVSALPYAGFAGLTLSVDALSGRFESKKIQPGRFELSLTAVEMGTVPLGQVRVEARQTLDLGDIRLDPPGSLVVKLRGPPELVGLRKLIRAESARGGVWAQVGPDGTARFASLAPGRYWVVSGRGGREAAARVAATSASVVIESGREASVELNATRGHVRRIQVKGLATDDVPGLRIQVHADGEDAVLLDWPFAAAPPNVDPEAFGAFAPGRYMAEAETADGRRASSSFEVRGEGEPPVVLAGFR